MDLPLKVVRQQISSAVDLIVQQTRLKDGQRKASLVPEDVLHSPPRLYRARRPPAAVRERDTKSAYHPHRLHSN